MGHVYPAAPRSHQKIYTISYKDGTKKSLNITSVNLSKWKSPKHKKSVVTKDRSIILYPVTLHQYCKIQLH